MSTAVMSSSGIALHGAPDTDIGTKDGRANGLQVMQLEMTQDIVDELLESVRSGKSPQISFGRTPQLKYGDKSHILTTSPESFRYELYESSGAGEDQSLQFTGLINHSLAVQKAEQVTAGVDTALEQLKNSMAAISEMKEANKTIVGDASPMPGHRRFPSKSFKPQHHLLPSSNHSSPLRSTPSGSPNMALLQGKTAGPTSQPGNSDKMRALRIPCVHLLAIEPKSHNWLLLNTKAKLVDVQELLTKIAKPKEPQAKNSIWSLTEKTYKELDPWDFPYQTQEDRQKAIDNAIKAFDRLRLAKDDKLWQKLLPKNERGKGKVLSRLNVTAPAQKASTPMQKISKLTEKKAVGTPKAGEKEEKEVKKVKEPKEKKPVKGDAEKAAGAAKSSTAKTSTPSTEVTKVRKKVTAPTDDSSTPRHKSKAMSRDITSKDKSTKTTKPPMPTNTKPKNPSPLSASPPVNASDFEDSHPVHKALSAAPSPAKTSSGNSDRSLKRKANDIDSGIHDHNLSVKSRKVNGATPTGTPLDKANGSTPSSSQSLKRKADDSDRAVRHDSHTPNTGNASKHRKMASIDTQIARYPIANHKHSSSSSSAQTQNNNPSSPGSSSSATSPTFPSLSFRQTVELSQKFQRYYKRYEELYWKLAEAEKPPSEQQREDLMKMHTKLEEMKRDINAGAGMGKA